MGIITTIFEALQSIVTSVGSLIASVFSSAVELIYTPGVGETGGQLTVVGVLMLISVAVGLFFFVLRWIRGLIKLR